MGQMRTHSKLQPETQKGKDRLRDLGVDRIILKWVIKKYGTRMWIGFIRVRTASSSGLL